MSVQKVIQAFLFILFTTSVCAYGEHQHQYTNATCNTPIICSECKETKGDAFGHTSAIGVCSRCGAVANEELLMQINSLFTEMMDTGTSLFSCLSDITFLDTNTQYDHFHEADKYTSAMSSIYDEVITTCADFKEMDSIVYQTNLLRNACPSPISGSDATSLDIQRILYQLYLQQLSSSCSYISETLDYWAGNRNQITEIVYYEEVTDMPTPDSIIYGISYQSTAYAAGNIQYTYLIGIDETEAILNYNLFLSALEANSGFKVDISDSLGLVFRDGNMVSVMMTGYDPSIGYFLIVSFQG